MSGNAYRRTVGLFSPQLERFFAGRVPNRHDAEELAQETLTRALESELRFRGDATVRTWVFAIARNVLREYRGRRRQQPDPTDEPSVGSALAPAYRHLEYDQTDQLAIAHAVADLPPHLRELWDLRYSERLPLAVCARRVGRPLGTVKYQLYVARQRLRRRFAGATATQ